MSVTERGTLAKDLERGRSRFQAWRERRLGKRIPQSLWRLAVRLVSSHGLSRTATALRLDYYSLKKQVESADPGQPIGPAFVELPAPVGLGKRCLFELDSGAGRSRRVQLIGYDAAEIADLARHFWDAE